MWHSRHRAELVDATGDLADALRHAKKTERKNRLYQELGLRVTYQPRQHEVLVEIEPDQHFVGKPVLSEAGVGLVATDYASDG